VNQSFGSSFASVDESLDPDSLRAYLDGVRAVPAVLAAKQMSLHLLDIKPGDRVLDIGCGPGDDTADIASFVGPEGQAFGIDKSEVLIAEARRTSGRRGLSCVEFMVADATALPFQENSFVSCRADRTIQHVPQADLALGEMARVIRPKGTVVISEMLNTLELDGEDRGAATDSVLERLWTDQERKGWIGAFLPLLLAQAGLTDVEVHRDSVRLTSFQDVAAVLNLNALCAGAVSAGVMDAERAETWLKQLAERFAEGHAALRCDFLHLRAYKGTSRN
jgi:ubiquinone/menaquinone biosynthesis C-methylase UbiE